MTSAAETSADAGSGLRALRVARLARAVALLIVGLGITFSAPLHAELNFVLWALIVGLALIGAGTVIEYSVLRGSPESWWIAARAIVAIGAAGTLLAAIDIVSAALVLSVWAALTGVISVLRLLRKVQPASIAVPSALLSFALAVIALVVREDPVALLGFFGAYAIIRGVFLGIAAFDRGATASPRSENAS